MNEVYFIFKNISSVDYLDIIKLPSIFKVESDIDLLEIEGRDGFLTIDKKTYRGIIKTVECQVKNLDQVDFICSWLDASGEVIFSNEPNKIYKATIKNQIALDQVVTNQTYHTFLIQFECQPHKYSIGNEIITLETPGTIFNSGSAISKPIVKVYGTGDVDLSINGNIVNLTDVDEYVTINSDLVDCYKDTMLKNNYMNGEFPILETGENNISWTGTVYKAEITPNFRYL